jgi:hypothetical protein
LFVREAPTVHAASVSASPAARRGMRIGFV